MTLVSRNWRKPILDFDADPTDDSSGAGHPTPARLTHLRQCQCSDDEPDILWNLSLSLDGWVHHMEARVLHISHLCLSLPWSTG